MQQRRDILGLATDTLGQLIVVNKWSNYRQLRKLKSPFFLLKTMNQLRPFCALVFGLWLSWSTVIQAEDEKSVVCLHDIDSVGGRGKFK